MTSVGVTRNAKGAHITTYMRVRFALLAWMLALAPVLTPYLLTPKFAVPKEVPTTHAGAHAGHHAKAPKDDPHLHPNCLRCVLFASALPVRVVLTPSAPLVGERTRLDAVLLPHPLLNPNVGARAPPDTARHS
jgi:hypothetical protein